MYIALLRRFLRFGSLAFGGPIAQIGMIKRELVDEERWIEPERFGRVLGVYQALPGPEAHELCVHFGMLKGGRFGGFLAGLGFMLPGFLLMTFASIGYVATSQGGSSAWLVAASMGASPAVVALVGRGAFRIARGALRGWPLWLGAGIAALLDVQGSPFWIALLIAALIAEAAGGTMNKPGIRIAMLAATVSLIALAVFWSVSEETAAPSGQLLSTTSLLAIFWIGLKGGLLTFGGAYTAIPFVRGLAVGPGGFMSDETFLDGLAIGSLLPAPLVIFATFVGYVGGGIPGAVVATIGMFLPAFAFTLLGFDLIQKVVDNPRIHTFLDGVTAGVVGIVAVTVYRLALVAFIDLVSVLVGLIALGILMLWKSPLSAPAAILAGICIGLLQA